MNCFAKPMKTSPRFVVSLLTTDSWSAIAASIESQPSFPPAAQPSLKKSAMSKPGSRSSSLRQHRELSTEVIALLPERHPCSTNELLDPLYSFNPVYLDAAAHVHAKRMHLSNRGTDVVWIQTAREQKWEGSTDFFRAPPVGTSACPSRHSVGVTVDQNSHRWPGGRKVAIDVNYDMCCVDPGSWSKCLQHWYR